MSGTYAAAEFEINVSVGGTAIPVTRVTCSYQRNSIPTATLMVPLGREVNSLSPNPIYGLTPGAMARIWVEVSIIGYSRGTDWAGADPPIIPGQGAADAFIIFAGWLTGMGYHREREKVYATLELTHWLADLNAASVLCQASNPANPADLIFPADGVLPDAGAVVGNTVNGRAAALVQAGLSGDLWGGIFKPWFAWYLAQNRLFSTDFAGPGAMNDAADGSASGALARIWSPYPFGFGDIATYLAEGVTADMTQNLADPDGEELSLANVTIWEKIVGHLAPTYHFDIIPRPMDALVVPVVPSLNATPLVTILARDQSIVKLNAGLQRPIRAVGLFANDILGHIGLEIKNGAFPSVVVGFAEASAYPAGLVLFRQAPQFLVGNSGLINRNYIEFISEYRDIMNGASGRLGPAVTRRQGFNRIKVIANKLAQIMYNEEALKDRNGVIAGPLRFDVCPGSTIRIQGVEDKSQYAFGLVQGVNCFVDSESQQAATAFQLAYLRSSAENAIPLMAASSHPLYGNVWWSGATLYTP